jgi:hypothetical protein
MQPFESPRQRRVCKAETLLVDSELKQMHTQMVHHVGARALVGNRWFLKSRVATMLTLLANHHRLLPYEPLPKGRLNLQDLRKTDAL